MDFSISSKRKKVDGFLRRRLRQADGALSALGPHSVVLVEQTINQSGWGPFSLLPQLDVPWPAGATWAEVNAEVETRLRYDRSASTETLLATINASPALLKTTNQRSSIVVPSTNQIAGLIYVNSHHFGVLLAQSDPVVTVAAITYGTGVDLANVSFQTRISLTVIFYDGTPPSTV